MLSYILIIFNKFILMVNDVEVEDELVFGWLFIVVKKIVE